MRPKIHMIFRYEKDATQKCSIHLCTFKVCDEDFKTYQVQSQKIIKRYKEYMLFFCFKCVALHMFFLLGYAFLQRFFHVLLQMFFHLLFFMGFANVSLSYVIFVFKAFLSNVFLLQKLLFIQVLFSFVCFAYVFFTYFFGTCFSYGLLMCFFHDFHSFFPTSFSHVFFILCLSFVLFPMCCFHRSVTFSPALSQHLQWQMLCPSGLVAWAMVIFEKTQMTPKVLPLFTVSSGFAFLSICLLHLFFSILICTCFSYVFPPCCCHTCFTMFLYVFHNFQRVFMCFFYMFSHFLFYIFLPCFTCFFIC